ncbi:unnamed protein product [Ectocarpus sp. 6 AP-2014]|uniref:Uncharacterized protein n=1 Tax=Ectocarpus siliculosus TaxID=2880 RepID=D8LQC2_ECTSI|nr:expressed unknown protein [Ectocarpus siliculosus]|eukprot:CBN78686.1 expressed unknown protein [Ectocarpus siliculosus]
MEDAKKAISNMGEEGVQDIAAKAQAALGGGKEGGKTEGGGNPLAGVDMDKAKATIESLGEKGVAEAKAALDKGDIKGAAESVMGNLGGGGGAGK